MTLPVEISILLRNSKNPRANIIIQKDINLDPKKLPIQINVLNKKISHTIRSMLWGNVELSGNLDNTVSIDINFDNLKFEFSEKIVVSAVENDFWREIRNFSTEITNKVAQRLCYEIIQSEQFRK